MTPDAFARTLDPSEDDDVWEGYEGCRNMAGTREYLERYPEGKHAAEARECLDWDTAKRCDKREPVLKFVRTYPNSRHRAEADRCLDRLEAVRLLKFQVEGLLRECRAHHEANRLTAGVAGNALECYRKVLNKQPGNAQALGGIARIERYYVDKAVASLEREEPGLVERWIERLSSINPEHPQVETLTAKLAELRQLLAEHERLAAARRQLREEVDALLAAGKPEAARAKLKEGRRKGLTGKALTALEDRVEKALAEAAIRAQSLSNLVGEVRSLVERGDVERARERLAEARALGLDDETHGNLLAAIGKAETRREAEARAAELARLLEECQRHQAEKRNEAALACYEKVSELQPGHAAAAAAVPGLKFKEAMRKNTVEVWFGFEQTYPGTGRADSARYRLQTLEEDYWKTVQAKGTRAAYERYLEIYPKSKKGRFTEQANAWLKRGE